METTTMDFSLVTQKIIKIDELLTTHKDKCGLYTKKCEEYNRLEKCYKRVKEQRQRLVEERAKLAEKNNFNSYKNSNDDYNKIQTKYDDLEREHKVQQQAINDIQIKWQTSNQELQDARLKISELEAEKIEASLAPKEEVPKNVKKIMKENLDMRNKNKELNRQIAELQLKVYEFNKWSLVVPIKQSVETQTLDVETSHVECEAIRARLESQLQLSNSHVKCKETQAKLESQLQLNNSHVKCKETQAKLESQLQLMNSHTKCKETQARLESQLQLNQVAFTKLNAELEKVNGEFLAFKLDASCLKEELEQVRIDNKKLKSHVGKVKSRRGTIEDFNANLRAGLEEIASEEQNEKVNLQKSRKSVEPCDNEVSEILLEMSVPASVSPIESLLEKGSMMTSTLSMVSPDQRQKTTIRKKSITASSGSFKITNDFVLSKSNPSKRKQRRIVKKSQRPKIDLYGALLALKRANINFTITSESLGDNNYNNQPFRDSTAAIKPYKMAAKKYDPKTKIKTCTVELKCHLKNCADEENFMVLKGSSDSDEEAPLLGFFSVKNELLTVASTASESPVTNTYGESTPLLERSPEFKVPSEPKRLRLKKRPANSDTCSPPSPSNDHSLFHMSSLVLSDDDDSINSPRVVKKSCSSRSRILRAFKTTKSTTNVNLLNDPVDVAVKKTRQAHAPVVKLNKSVGVVEPEVPPPIRKRRARSDIGGRVPLVDQEKPATAFKRPVCRTRQSLRLQNCGRRSDKDRPESPPLEEQRGSVEPSIVVPLKVNEPECERDLRMKPSKIEVLFQNLLNYSGEEKALDEVVMEFANQEPEYVARAVLERVAKDTATPTCDPPAPLLTPLQQTMLGFMHRLENKSQGLVEHFQCLAEQRLLQCTILEELSPITRLYLAICKLHKNFHRMRRFCCDFFYFGGDLAVPFLHIVLTSWGEILPRADEADNVPLAKILVQIVYMKGCNQPGHNLLPLRDLLIKYYGYPSERWDSDELFEEVFERYKKSPVRSSDYAILLLCKNHPERWVVDKIEGKFKPLFREVQSENFKAAVIILIGNLSHRFSAKPKEEVRGWMEGLLRELTDDMDLVKRSVYLCLNRLKRK